MSPKDYRCIRLERPADHVVRVVLDRPAQANAFSARLLDELDDALQAIAADDDVHVWMLTGAPRADGRAWFSAGLDMKDALAGAASIIDPVKIVDLTFRTSR